MNPGPAPRPPVTPARLNLTPAVNNIPGNMIASNFLSQQYNSSSTSLSRQNEKDGGGGALSVIKEGFAQIKEEGFLSNFLWKEKWLVLREMQLDFHKSANSPKISFSIVLRDVTGVSRSENQPFSFEITRLANPGTMANRGDAAMKTVICRVETDDDVYSWIDSIYERCPGMGGVSNPTNFAHQVHVGFDPTSGAFIGLPAEWEKLLNASAISKEDYQKNPAAVIEVLNFYTENLVKQPDEPMGYSGLPPTPSTDSNTHKQLGYAGAGSIAQRPKPPNQFGQIDNYDTPKSAIDRTTPIVDSSVSPAPNQQVQQSHDFQMRVDQERRRRTDEDARREQSRRERSDRERERERENRTKDEQSSFNSSIPKVRTPLAKQELGGYGGSDVKPQENARYNITRATPSPTDSRDRSQPAGSLRQMTSQRPAPSAPNQSNGTSSTIQKQTQPSKQLLTTTERQSSPNAKSPTTQTNGQRDPAVTRIPIASTPKQDQNQKPNIQTAAALKPLNVTIKQPTGAAAVAEAAKKAEEMPAKKEQGGHRRDVRMSAMTEAEVMTKLREVVSKEAPLQSYNKQKKIGQGASGSVYVARIRENATSNMARQIVHNQGPRAQVAIKQMDLRNQPRKELIVNEIVVMKESKHPNIVNFIEAFLPEEQTELWVVMEFMEGGPLTDVIDNNPSIGEDQIATICLEVSTFSIHFPVHCSNAEL